MSVLTTVKKYMGIGTEEPVPSRPHTLSLKEKAGMAAADRGFAFEQIEDALEALNDASLLEAEVAAESLRRAENSLLFAKESAARILATGQANAVRYEEQAAHAQSNSDDDNSAVRALEHLVTRDLSDVPPQSSDPACG